MLIIVTAICAQFGRLIYLMVFQSEYYEEKAQNLHERERSIKAARGKITDRNGIVLADNQSVCTISVIHSQLTDPEQVIRVLCKELELPEENRLIGRWGRMHKAFLQEHRPGQYNALLT